MRSVHLSSWPVLMEGKLQGAFGFMAFQRMKMSVIVLSFSCIEATLRQLKTDDYSSNAFELLGDDKDLDWLRTIRNEILHSGEPRSVSKLWKLPSSDDIPACQASLEPEAKRAVRLAFRVIYANTKLK